VDFVESPIDSYSGLLELNPGVRFLYMPETESTNGALLKLIRAGEIRGAAVLYTDRQYAGRGSRGRVWLQPGGDVQALGLDIAITLAAPMEGPQLTDPRITLLAGALAALVLERESYTLDIEPGGVLPPVYCLLGLKWPNDILADARGWRKAGGILCETAQHAASGKRWIVIGVGINVNSTQKQFPPELQPSVTTLRDWQHAQLRRGADFYYDRDALLTALANELARLARGVSVDTPTLLGAWQARDRTRGRHYLLERDGCKLEVTAAGIDMASGGLIVRDGHGKNHLVQSFSELTPSQ
jgi:BirA family biotin operon repressor/biotin-[acetyl-CoA-carboxylase] ligase